MTSYIRNRRKKSSNINFLAQVKVPRFMGKRVWLVWKDQCSWKIMSKLISCMKYDLGSLNTGDWNMESADSNWVSWVVFSKLGVSDIEFSQFFWALKIKVHVEIEVQVELNSFLPPQPCVNPCLHGSDCFFLKVIFLEDLSYSLWFYITLSMTLLTLNYLT